jgi:hypothetical protein
MLDAAIPLRILQNILGRVRVETDENDFLSALLSG